MDKLQLKIPPPVYLFLAAIIMWGIDALGFNAFNLEPVNNLKWLFLIIGLILDLTSLAHFVMRKTTPSPFSPNKTNQLIITAWYRFSRNPMYLGMCFMLIAWAIHLGNASTLIVIPLFIWVLNTMQIKPEEFALQNKFGAQYTAYREQVRRWI